MTRPRIKPITTIDLLKPQHQKLPNGIPLHVLNACPEDVSRIDLIFEAGVWNQPHPLVAFFTNQMLREGNAQLSSGEIAEKLDFYGSWLQLSNGYHHSFVTLYSLNKYLPQTLAVLEQMIKVSVFPEAEFQTILNTRKQQYLVDSEKVNVLASRRFQQTLYGKDHPYGKVSKLEDYETLTIDSLKDFYNTFYHSGNCTIVLSGNINEEAIIQVERFFGTEKWGSQQTFSTPKFAIKPGKEKYQFINKEDAVQSAVIIGKPLVTYTHPDYHLLQVLATVLGGYFGSRLMSNIREDKGYTYGISSYISAMRYGGHFTIASQTGTAYTQLLSKEVYKEMEKLCTKPVSKRELKVVQSYMLGDVVRNFDGVFAQAEALVSLLTRGLDYSFYEKNIEVIKNITAEQLQQLAQHYFARDSFYEVVCGQAMEH